MAFIPQDGSPVILGAAFELRSTPSISAAGTRPPFNTRRRQYSVSSSSSSLSSSFAMSSTESDTEDENDRNGEHDTSWSSVDPSMSPSKDSEDEDSPPRDPLSASAKPVNGLRLYSKPEPGSLTRQSPGRIRSGSGATSGRRTVSGSSTQSTKTVTGLASGSMSTPRRSRSRDRFVSGGGSATISSRAKGKGRALSPSTYPPEHTTSSTTTYSPSHILTIPFNELAPNSRRSRASLSPETSGRNMIPRVLFSDSGMMLGAPMGTGAVSEKQFWDKILCEAIDNGTGKLDLSFPVARYPNSLTYIPPNIIDLKKLVVLNTTTTTTMGSSTGRATSHFIPTSTLTSPAAQEPPSLSDNPALSLSAPRTFNRVVSAPAAYSAMSNRTFERSATTAPGARPGRGSGIGLGRPGENAISTSIGEDESQAEATIELYLAGNAIKRLPRELFALKGLTVLSLRANGLEFIPPCISNLTSLRELQISQNRLKYLPAEIQQLKLVHVGLTANPWIQPPKNDNSLPGFLASSDTLSSSKSRVLAPSVTRKIWGNWKSDSRVVPLVELAYRVLLTPMPNTPTSNDPSSKPHLVPPPSPVTSSLLPPSSPSASHYDSQVLNWQIYDQDEWFGEGAPMEYRSVFEVLKAATSGLSSPSDSQSPNPLEETETPTQDRIALLETASYYPHHCPSPFHHRPSLSSSTSSSKSNTPAYFHHAEERMEWVNEIAGVAIPGSLRVPILWRGCENGCLAFLEEGDKEMALTDELSDDSDWGLGDSDSEQLAPSASRFGPVDSQRTIRPSSRERGSDGGGFSTLNEEDEDSEGDGFNVDDLDGLGS